MSEQKNKEENKLYMYFYKDGVQYAKSMPLENLKTLKDIKLQRSRAKLMGERGIMTWKKINVFKEIEILSKQKG